MLIKRFLAALMVLSILVPEIIIAAPGGYDRHPLFKGYITYDAERGVFVDTSARMDMWCRISQWRDPATGRRCGDPRDVPALRLVIPQSVYSPLVSGSSSSAAIRYRNAKDKIQDLARAVSIAVDIPVETIVAKSSSSGKLSEARTLLIGLASKNRLISDGEVQDILNCSQKDIRSASDLLITNEKLARAADTIWSAYSAMRITQVNRETRRVLTMTDVTQAASRALGVSWQDARMYVTDNHRPECKAVLEVVVVVACDVLRKDVRSVARVLALSESDVHAFYRSGRLQVSGRDAVRANALRVCHDLDVKPPTDWV